MKLISPAYWQPFYFFLTPSNLKVQCLMLSIELRWAIACIYSFYLRAKLISGAFIIKKKTCDFYSLHSNILLYAGFLLRSGLLLWSRISRVFWGGFLGDFWQFRVHLYRQIFWLRMCIMKGVSISFIR